MCSGANGSRTARRKGKPDLAGLTAFTGRKDRQSALFFAGRAREIEAVERTCAAALDSVRAGAPFQGATRLFQGAPGAGKTALLTALQQRWGKPDAPADAPLPVVLEWGHLHSEAVVAGAILKAVDPAMEETYRRTGAKPHTLNQKPGLQGIPS